MSISKVNSSQLRPIAAPSNFNSGGAKVTYHSVNDEAGEAFSAATPPNSVHAAKLAQIAMAMQAQTRREQQQKKPEPKGLLSAISQRLHLQIQGPAPVAPQRYLPPAGDGKDVGGPAVEEPMNRSRTDKYDDQCECRSPSVQQRPPEVTRYRTEDRTAYKVRGQNGTVRVSAPAGSNEAGLFDALAVANSTGSLPSADSAEGVRSVVKKGERGGWVSGW
ncbi:hypothetical protein B0T16DRAFT_456750 [Cercophora newfieldiana]|uniref:Uncharacterized protein n=1 Tax=Cercophora newfieldiana TaxID=92897 RepID=A0AA40CS96_9PEZI|nr:hypothetical protein B0T16DRAFT_456750 [Cercophora newfieldiana]